MRACRVAFLLVACSLALTLAACAPQTPALPPTPAAPSTVTPTPPTQTLTPPALPPTQAFPTPEPSPAATVQVTLPEAMEVILTADQPYAGDRLLDIYAPAVGGDWPVVVVLHGGGLSKSVVSSLARAIAGQGAVAFVPTYTSSEPSLDAIARGAIPRGAEEAACAVRYARAMAAEHGGNARRVVAAGHSAGGAFAVLVALAGDEFVGDCTGSKGSGSVDGVIGLDGAYDLMRYIQPWILEKASAEEWLAISPYAWIDRQPPRSEVTFRLFAGLETELVQDGQAMRDALLAAGYQAEFTQIPRVDHMGMAGVRPQTLEAILEMARGS